MIKVSGIVFGKQMFAVIYQGYLKNGREAAYCQAWKRVARYFIEKRGAIGSCLHRTPEGVWVAYSRWPDKKTRDASWGNDRAEDFPEEIREAMKALKDCLDEERKIPEICMDVMDDLFVKE